MKHCPICDENYKDELTNCPKCNHVLETGMAPKVVKKSVPVFSIVVCALGILFGIGVFMGSLSGGEAIEFGADFYTDIYEQSVKMVENTKSITKAIGGFITLYFTLQLSKILSNG